MATIGCRRSELLAMTVGDLDLDGGVATIRASIADGGPGTKTYRKATKRDDWRDVPLTPQMVDVFGELLSRRRVAVEAFGGGLSISTVMCSATTRTVLTGFVPTRCRSGGSLPGARAGLPLRRQRGWG